MTDKTDIINEITTHIHSYGGLFSSWYCGITDDSHHRLFTEHHVSEDHGIYIARTAQNRTDAELIEKYFLDKGCEGAAGGRNEQSKVVYAYLMTSSTNP